MVSWLKTTDIPISTISRETGISRNTLYNWILGNTEIRDSNYKKIEEEYGEYFLSQNNEEGTKMHQEEREKQANQLIHYQQKEIEALKADLAISEAKANLNKVDNEYEQCIPHFETVVQMRGVFSLKAIERMIQICDDLRPLAKALEIEERLLREEYFKFGSWFKNNEHPVDKIIDKENLNVLKQATNGVPKQAKLFQFTMSAFYMKFDICYNLNNRFALTKSYCKINWSMTPIIETKNIILHSGSIDQLNGTKD